jgi:hypothetical protein
MSTVVYVHGTGVREPRYSAGLERVTRLITGVRGDVCVVGCYWGERFGARLAAGGASVPDVGRSRGTDQADEVAAWWLLYADPLIELRDAAGPAAEGLSPPGRARPGEAVIQRALACTQDPRIARRAALAGVGDTLADAAAAICDHPDVRPALRDPHLGDALPRLFARAVVAEAVRRAEQEADEPVVADGAARDALVDALTHLLEPEASGRAVPPVVVAAITRTAGLAWRLGGARAVERRRRCLIDAAHPLPGDVLVYLARGAEIRDLIAEQVRAAGPEPVTLLGHSLGGVACVDLLVERPDLPVRTLITVGSQAPFLYELGALPSLRHPDPLPGHFPRWVNLYDERDLLAFVGAEVFPGRVRDVRVDSRQPFPQAHGAYWALGEVGDLLAAELP